MGKRILIADDALIMRLLLKNILSGAGYEICGEAENGQAALELYRSLSPDLVTLDITMPVHDGLWACREILKEDTDANVVMITAMGQQAMILEAVSYGAKDFIVKPFQADKVIAICGYEAETTEVPPDELIYALRSLEFTLKKGFQMKKVHRLNVNPLKGDVVTAGDIEMLEGLSLTDTEMPIITASFGLKGIYITSGRGFIPADKMQPLLPEGATAIDANFCPIEKIEYTVEPIRQGSMIDKDKLTIRIIGKNIEQIKSVLDNTLSEIKEICSCLCSLTDNLPDEPMIFKCKKEEKTDSRLTMPIEDVILNLPTRARNVLKKNQIRTFEDLLAIGKKGLSTLRNMGEKTVDEVTK